MLTHSCASFCTPCLKYPPCGNLFSIHCFTSQQLRIYSWQIYDAEMVRYEIIQLLLFFMLQSNRFWEGELMLTNLTTSTMMVDADGDLRVDGFV
jgi:hypothetical protein